MLTPAKKAKLLAALKAYNKKYLDGRIKDLDESGTRLMINDFLTLVLGYVPIEEVRTEYMIKGTYADYVIRLKGQQKFLVEVKALPLELTEKHLRQAVNYGANEGIEWALLTNARSFDLYKIIISKPKIKIDSKKVFSLNLEDITQLKKCIEFVQFIHRDSVISDGLASLWNKSCALSPGTVAGILYSPAVVNIIKKTLKGKFKSKFSDEEIFASLNRVVEETIPLDSVKPLRGTKVKPKVLKDTKSEPTLTVLEMPPGEAAG